MKVHSVIILFLISTLTLAAVSAPLAQQEVAKIQSKSSEDIENLSKESAPAQKSESDIIETAEEGDLEELPQLARPAKKPSAFLPAWLTKKNIAIAGGVILASALGLLMLNKKAPVQEELVELPTQANVTTEKSYGTAIEDLQKKLEAAQGQKKWNDITRIKNLIKKTYRDALVYVMSNLDQEGSGPYEPYVPESISNFEAESILKKLIAEEQQATGSQEH